MGDKANKNGLVMAADMTVPNDNLQASLAEEKDYGSLKNEIG